MKSIKTFAATLVTGAGITAALLGAGTASADSTGTPNFGAHHVTSQTATPHFASKTATPQAGSKTVQSHAWGPGWMGPGQPQLTAHGHLNLKHQLNPVQINRVSRQFRGHLWVLR